MRIAGYSYSEIMGELHVPKSTLSNWLKDMPLSEQQTNLLKVRLVSKVSKGRLRASVALRSARVFRETKAFDEAIISFEKYSHNPFFTLGVGLYWAEGGKKSGYFQFTNSDPDMVVIMLNWMEKFLGISRNDAKYRLFIHSPYRNERCEEYWASVMGVNLSLFYETIYKSTQYDIKKNLEYKGCIRVTVTKIELLRKVTAWQKLLIKYYGKV